MRDRSETRPASQRINSASNGPLAPGKKGPSLERAIAGPAVLTPPTGSEVRRLRRSSHAPLTYSLAGIASISRAKALRRARPPAPAPA